MQRGIYILPTKNDATKVSNHIDDYLSRVRVQGQQKKCKIPQKERKKNYSKKSTDADLSKR